MRSRLHTRQRGYTLIELTMTIAILGTSFLGVGRLMATTHDVVTDSERETQARSIERRNIDSLSAILRGVTLTTLANFDVNGLAVAPQFSRSVNIINGLPEPTAQAQLAWMPSPNPAIGIPSPGSVWLLENGGSSLAAKNVPAGGFAVEQDGKRLIIRLTTYYPGNVPEEAILRNSTTVVWPRN